MEDRTNFLQDFKRKAMVANDRRFSGLAEVIKIRYGKIKSQDIRMKTLANKHRATALNNDINIRSE